MSDIWCITLRNNKDEFVSMMNEMVIIPSMVWFYLASNGATKCARALLKGKTRHEVKLDCPSSFLPLTTLHYAVEAMSPEMVKLYLRHNAPTNYRGRNISNDSSYVNIGRYTVSSSSVLFFYIKCCFMFFLCQG